MMATGETARFRMPIAGEGEREVIARVGAVIGDVFREKYGAPERWGWTPRMRFAAGYASPDDWYEALLSTMVGPQTMWLDVGCGRDLFPSNVATARRLAGMCRRLVGVDPDTNVHDNDFVHERVRSMLEDYRTEQRFDLITLRMVAEHVTEPARLVAKLRELLAPGGKVVIYTVNRWSPSAVAASVTPMWVHHAVKHVLWRVEERDTFDTVYRMNERGTLRALFEGAGMREVAFVKVDDCRASGRFAAWHRVELAVAGLLHRLGLRYPENCLVGIYQG